MATFKREDLRRVLFSDLSEQCDEELIHELCVQFGPITKITWPVVTNISGMPQRKSYCFVDFLNPEDAKYCFEALYRSQVKLFEKEIRVSHASTELGQREIGARTSAAHGAIIGLHEVGAKVIVRNVDITATEFDLTRFFEQFGPFAVPPRMMRDFSGNFRGTVIFSYKDFSSSDKVIAQMDQRVYRDRVITVQYAELEDGSGRLHGSPEERANASIIREEEKKYLAKLSQENAEARKDRQQQRTQNTSWAEGVDVYAASRPR